MDLFALPLELIDELIVITIGCDKEATIVLSSCSIYLRERCLYHCNLLTEQEVRRAREHIEKRPFHLFSLVTGVYDPTVPRWVMCFAMLRPRKSWDNLLRKKFYDQKALQRRHSPMGRINQLMNSHSVFKLHFFLKEGHDPRFLLAVLRNSYSTFNVRSDGKTNLLLWRGMVYSRVLWESHFMPENRYGTLPFVVALVSNRKQKLTGPKKHTYIDLQINKAEGRDMVWLSQGLEICGKALDFSDCLQLLWCADGWPQDTVDKPIEKFLVRPTSEPRKTKAQLERFLKNVSDQYLGGLNWNYLKTDDKWKWKE